jgi:tetratricopeptide (TPR) repeat protein
MTTRPIPTICIRLCDAIVTTAWTTAPQRTNAFAIISRHFPRREKFNLLPTCNRRLNCTTTPSAQDDTTRRALCSTTDLQSPLYFQLGAYQLCIELLRALFPDGEDKPPRLKDASDQAWTLNALANSYSLAGLPRRAVPLFLASNDDLRKARQQKSVAIGLGNVAHQLVIGELQAAERNLRRRIEICREIKDEFKEAVGHQELGRVLAYRGEFAEAARELAISTAYWEKTNDAQGQSIDSAYRALRALLMGDASAALAAARQARAFAEEMGANGIP